MPKLTLSLLALQSVLIGLRWTYDFRDSLLIQATLATLIPPLVLLSMRQMVSTQAAKEPLERVLLYCIPALVVLVSPLLNLTFVDWIIEAVVIGFGIALVYLGMSKDIEWRDRVPFAGVLEASIAFIVSGCALLMSALVDVAVYYDIAQNSGQMAAQIVGIANLIVLLCLVLGVLLLNRRTDPGRLQDTPAPAGLEADTAAEPEDAEELQQARAALLEKMDAVIAERKLYRDPDLSLDRLSRKLMIPSRQISLAVNSQRAMNVSQYINLFRVAEAAYLVKAEKCSITEVIYEVGFNTKSNFNREFKRIVGVSPSEWRKGHDSGGNSPLEKFQEDVSTDLAWEPVQALAESA
ncbi:helix-turn-helix domain-containing protein [Leisingera thetidis]|uniref:helix-turn-helix domain-containing protein n=1 Tax=Leisingera thetidis TaxID=2930199 RepID=UPI0021F78C13|nr:AraC family transcriptional regulator [Leisingera thetidis]